MGIAARQSGRDGEIGRRGRLKISCPSRDVRVRAPLPAGGRAVRKGGHIAGPVRVVEWVGSEPPLPNRPALRAGFPKCGVSRTETPEREWLGSGNPSPSRSWLGNRNFLARLRRAAASSDWSLLIVKGGRAPLSHFPPRTRWRQTLRVRRHWFFRTESARGKGTPTSGRHRCASRSEMADRSFLSLHAGQGTPTSGRHRCA